MPSPLTALSLAWAGQERFALPFVGGPDGPIAAAHGLDQRALDGLRHFRLEVQIGHSRNGQQLALRAAAFLQSDRHALAAEEVFHGS